MSTEWRNSTITIDTENKQKWCEEGLRYEQDFVRLMTRLSHLQVSMNPEKVANPLAPDLFVPGFGLCDLKTQKTPFFTASRYELDPSRAITLNTKDVMRYRDQYPEIGIFFWIDWQNRKLPDQRFREVPYRWGVYFTTIREILSFIDKGIAKKHEYGRRKSDDPVRLNKLGMNKSKNATHSYVLSCDWFQPILASNNDPWYKYT